MYDGDYIERLLLFEKPLTSRFRKNMLSFLHWKYYSIVMEIFTRS